MDFWSAYIKKRDENDFGSKPVLLSSGERYHTSVAAVDGKCIELLPGFAFFKDYNTSNRYVIARELTFDLLLSFYDVNSKRILVARPTMPFVKKDVEGIKYILGRWMNRPNLEIRAIGLQDGDTSMLSAIDLMQELNGSLVELDLFGNQTRHIVMDMLTGKPFSLLLLNRIYRPGELNNSLPRDEFDKKRSKLNLQ